MLVFGIVQIKKQYQLIEGGHRETICDFMADRNLRKMDMNFFFDVATFKSGLSMTQCLPYSPNSDDESEWHWQLR